MNNRKKMKKIMFSIHMGDSVAHVLRTRSIAKHLLEEGYDLIYSVPEKALPFLEDFIDRKYIYTNSQSYSYAQMPYKDIYNQYRHHATSESIIFQQYRPDILIGDTGLIAYVYNPKIPFIKILNRFYIEIESKLDSPYKPDEKLLIRTQIEELINNTRKELNITETFRYEQFISPPVLINGASYFVDDIDRCYKFAGINMALRHSEILEPDFKKCLVIFGTGLSYNRVKLASEILRELENHFETIYVSYGIKINKEYLYEPKNAIMKPLFDNVPDNIGVLICHGGWGTMHLGVELGIPIIAIPFQIEQYSNAYHMQNLGIGVNVGIYNRLNFKGIFEDFSLDWNALSRALSNIENIRKKGILKNTLNANENLLSSHIDNFLESY